jgi:diaminopimelate decarboxylase
VMSSNYNSRTRAPELMVDGDQVHIIRQRETIEDLLNGEQLLPTAQG